MSDPILDRAVDTVFASETVRAAYRRFGVTSSIYDQIMSQYRMQQLEAEIAGDTVLYGGPPGGSMGEL